MRLMLFDVFMGLGIGLARKLGGIGVLCILGLRCL
jgi:hypothetical protein